MDFFIGGTLPNGVTLSLGMANRHGLIAGATGTGKTVSLQTLAEGFSSAGVPVFITDIKGDLSGLARPGEMNDRIAKRVEAVRLNGFNNRAFPVVFWDIFGKNGYPLRTTISEMGPLLLANLLDLNETQTAVLFACFKIADDEGLLLLDMKDLRSLLTWVSENAKSLQSQYGNLSSSSIAAVQRGLLVLEQQGAVQFFGEPALQLGDIMQSDFSGNGVISILDATDLLPRPKLYASCLLWLLADLYEQLPEVGDAAKPKLVLFFDEAHLLFKNAPDVLIEQVEQVVRLIRSKGVGVYFVTQTPSDIPSGVAGQLGNRIQHALRSFTPKDQQAVKAAARTMRANPNLDTAAVISELGVGEALVSVLDTHGQPTAVERVLIHPPASRIGPLNTNERSELMQRSPMAGKYDQLVDRVSAHEVLSERGKKAFAQQELDDYKRKGNSRQKPSQLESLAGTVAKSAMRSIGSQLGRQVARGLLGAFLGGRKR